MSSQLSNSLRRTLNVRQRENVEKLFAAGRELLGELGHEEITMRMVAERAGLSPATAYTLIASKDHLYAELFARLFADREVFDLTEKSARLRTQQVMAHLASVIAGAPELAAAVNKALLASDPDVERIRRDIGTRWIEYLQDALGEDADGVVLETLVYAFSGALLQAGIGVLSYDDLGAALERVVDAVVVDSPRSSRFTLSR